MTHIEHLLTILGEECNETAQRASKTIRFGPEEIQPGQPFTNAERLKEEFNHIVAMMEVLHSEGIFGKLGDFGDIYDREIIKAKKQKVSEYMGYSKTCGTIEPGQKLMADDPVPMAPRCMVDGCNQPSIHDYNGHGHFVCSYHYDRLSREFDEEYR